VLNLYDINKWFKIVGQFFWSPFHGFSSGLDEQKKSNNVNATLLASIRRVFDGQFWVEKEGSIYGRKAMFTLPSALWMMIDVHSHRHVMMRVCQGDPHDNKYFFYSFLLFILSSLHGKESDDHGGKETSQRSTDTHGYIRSTWVLLRVHVCV
jgi:hypothetical protein